jgi:hypothetical protein
MCTKVQGVPGIMQRVLRNSFKTLLVVVLYKVLNHVEGLTWVIGMWIFRFVGRAATVLAYLFNIWTSRPIFAYQLISFFGVALYKMYVGDKFIGAMDFSTVHKVPNKTTLRSIIISSTYYHFNQYNNYNHAVCSNVCFPKIE